MVLQTTKRRTSGLSRDDVPRRPHSKTVFDTPLPCTESINHMVGQWMECIFTRLEILEKQSVSADDRSSPEEGGRHPIRTLRNASEPIQDGVSGAFATACHVPTHQRLHDRLEIVFHGSRYWRIHQVSPISTNLSPKTLNAWFAAAAANSPDPPTSSAISEKPRILNTKLRI